MGKLSKESRDHNSPWTPKGWFRHSVLVLLGAAIFAGTAVARHWIEREKQAPGDELATFTLARSDSRNPLVMDGIAPVPLKWQDRFGALGDWCFSFLPKLKIDQVALSTNSYRLAATYDRENELGDGERGV